MKRSTKKHDVSSLLTTLTCCVGPASLPTTQENNQNIMSVVVGALIALFVGSSVIGLYASPAAAQTQSPTACDATLPQDPNTYTVNYDDFADAVRTTTDVDENGETVICLRDWTMVTNDEGGWNSSRPFETIIIDKPNVRIATTHERGSQFSMAYLLNLFNGSGGPVFKVVEGGSLSISDIYFYAKGHPSSYIKVFRGEIGSVENCIFDLTTRQYSYLSRYAFRLNQATVGAIRNSNFYGWTDTTPSLGAIDMIDTTADSIDGLNIYFNTHTGYGVRARYGSNVGQIRNLRVSNGEQAIEIYHSTVSSISDIATVGTLGTILGYRPEIGSISNVSAHIPDVAGGGVAERHGINLRGISSARGTLGTIRDIDVTIDKIGRAIHLEYMSVNTIEDVTARVTCTQEFNSMCGIFAPINLLFSQVRVLNELDLTTALTGLMVSDGWDWGLNQPSGPPSVNLLSNARFTIPSDATLSGDPIFAKEGFIKRTVDIAVVPEAASTPTP